MASFEFRAPETRLYCDALRRHVAGRGSVVNELNLLLEFPGGADDVPTALQAGVSDENAHVVLDVGASCGWQ